MDMPVLREHKNRQVFAVTFREIAAAAISHTRNRTGAQRSWSSSLPSSKEEGEEGEEGGFFKYG
jgi:hypothetical protein